MARTSRALVAVALLCAAVAVLGTRGIAFTDYEVEAEPAALALAGGHLGRFADLAPAYGGSLVLRAPFAWAAHALGFGTDLGLYRALVLPALLASAALALVLWRRLEGRGAWLVLVAVAANPFAMRAYDIGHPEDVVGAALCVGAVLAALRGRPVLAGLLVGLAVANKPWALVAAPCVLLALDARRGRCALAAATACALVLGPLLLWGQAARAVGDAARNDTTIFQPWQLFWFFGKHTGPIQRIIGERVGYRASVPWAQAVSHPAVVLVAVGLALAWWPRRRPADALALLALVGLTRCLLDTWNTDYYGVPFLFALAAHEVVGRGRAPRATLVVTLAFWVTIELLPGPDAQTAGYLAVAGTTWVCLALTTYAPARAARLARRARCAAARALPTLLGQPTSSATAAPSSPALTA